MELSEQSARGSCRDSNTYGRISKKKSGIYQCMWKTLRLSAPSMEVHEQLVVIIVHPPSTEGQQRNLITGLRPDRSNTIPV